MCDKPLVSTSIPKQLCAGHEEHPPALQASLRFAGTEIFAESRQDCRSVSIEILQPLFAGAPVVQATYIPMLLDLQVVVEVTK